MTLLRRGSGGGPEKSTDRWGLTLTRRLGGRNWAAPVLDPSYGDEALALLLRQASAGDWDSLRTSLAAVDDASERTWLLTALADVGGVETWIPRAVAAEPESALPLLLSGARQVSWAWEARTARRARYVSEEQWRVFHERLKVAEEQLYEVAEREPGWLAPWYFLQISGRGESVGAEVGRYRFEAALRRCPGHPDSHQQRLQQLCAKWSGSHEAMHDFARTAMRSAPEGSPLGELVAIAHLERWVDLEDGADSTYLRDPAVVAELHEALDRSILNPAYKRPRGWKAAYNTFAMAFALAEDRQTARSLFKEIGGTVTKFPWCYAGEPTAAFRSCRKACAR